MQSAPASSRQDANELMTYSEAAALLGVKLDTVRQLVKRSRLHAVADPANRVGRLVYRREVEARAGLTRSELLATSAPASPSRMPGAPAILTTQEAALVGVGLIALGLLIFAALHEEDAVTRGLAWAALAAFALVIAAEWYKQGTIDRAERRRIEQLARTVESEPDALVTELLRLGVTVPATPANE